MSPREAPGAAVAAGQAQEQYTEATIIVAGSDAERKAFDDVAALAALQAGAQLYKLANGRFLLVRGALTAECATLEAVRARLARMGGSA